MLPAMVLIINILISSCDGLFPGLPVSITGRIDSFETDLNKTDRSSLYRNFHPTETANYNQIKLPDFFSGSPLSETNIPFSINIPGTPVDQANGRKLVTGTLTHKYATLNIQFIMLQSGEDWYIEELILPDVDAGGTPWAIRKIVYQ